MENTKKIPETLASALERELRDVPSTEIWEIRYKLGPIMRTEHIQARDLAHAKVQRERYLRSLSMEKMEKIIALGEPKPFAIDVDEFLRKKNEADVAKAS